MANNELKYVRVLKESLETDDEISSLGNRVGNVLYEEINSVVACDQLWVTTRDKIDTFLRTPEPFREWWFDQILKNLACQAWNIEFDKLGRGPDADHRKAFKNADGLHRDFMNVLNKKYNRKLKA